MRFLGTCIGVIRGHVQVEDDIVIAEHLRHHYSFHVESSNLDAHVICVLKLTKTEQLKIMNT